MLGGFYAFNGMLPGSSPINWKGTWDASTNTPALASGVGTAGDWYTVSVAGTTTLDGESDWAVGDSLVFDDNLSAWIKIEGSENWMRSGTIIHLAGFTSVTTPVYLSNSAPALSLHLDSSGRLGIGGATPGANLYVGGSGGRSALIRSTDANSDLTISSNTPGQTSNLGVATNGGGIATVNIGTPGFTGYEHSLAIQKGTAPGTVTDKLYNIAGVLTWAGNALSVITASGVGSGEQITLKSPDGSDHYIRINDDGSISSV